LLIHELCQRKIPASRIENRLLLPYFFAGKDNDPTGFFPCRDGLSGCCLEDVRGMALPS
jgi:hypothetical protein